MRGAFENWQQVEDMPNILYVKHLAHLAVFGPNTPRNLCMFDEPFAYFCASLCLSSCSPTCPPAPKPFLCVFFVPRTMFRELPRCATALGAKRVWQPRHHTTPSVHARAKFVVSGPVLVEVGSLRADSTEVGQALDSLGADNIAVVRGFVIPGARGMLVAMFADTALATHDRLRHGSGHAAVG